MGKRSSFNTFLSHSSPSDVNEVKSNKRSGITDVPGKIDRLLVEKLSYVTSFIFDWPIEQGVFPKKLKNSKILTVDKSGSLFPN